MSAWLTQLLTLGAGVYAVGALIFTAPNFILSRHYVELTRQTLKLTRQGQVTDRYAKAIDQLDSDKLDVRIGGIYALERIARDSRRDHPTILEVLAAFVRGHFVSNGHRWNLGRSRRSTEPGPTSKLPSRSVAAVMSHTTMTQSTFTAPTPPERS